MMSKDVRCYSSFSNIKLDPLKQPSKAVCICVYEDANVFCRSEIMRLLLVGPVQAGAN